MICDVVVVAREGARVAPDFPGCRVIAVLDGGEALGDFIRLRNEARIGFVRSANRGLLVRERDVLLVDGDARAAPAEMLSALRASDRIAAVATPGCILFRHLVLNMIGALDPAFTRRDDALADWVMRAQRLGFRHSGALGDDCDPAASPLLKARHPHYPDQLKLP